MKEFFTESVLPFLAVCLLTAGLTWLSCDVPANASHVEPRPGAAGAHSVDRDMLNETLARTLRILDATRTTAARPASDPGTARPQGGVEPVALIATEPAAGAVAPSVTGRPLAPTAQGTLTAVSALAEAIKAVRNARTEQDLADAEARMRTAREQMEATCGDPGSALCAPAQEIRALGY